MKNYLLTLGILSILFYCKKQKAISDSAVTNKKDSTKIERNYIFNKNSIFGVYQLTDKDFAICIPVQFDN
jgi:hypothetical protein